MQWRGFKMSIENQIAVVTGGSRGIGKAIAQQLLVDGYFVVATATSESGANAIQEYLGENGKALELNLASSESCEVFCQAVNDLGAVSVLVNNAGITKDGLLVRMKEADWSDVLETNLSGVFRVSKGLLKAMMKKRHGRIINISSVVGTMGNPGQANYCASKAGLEGFTRSLAYELGSRGITVNAVAPGMIATDMTHELTDEQKQAMMANIPLGRYGEGSEVAKTVSFLASDGAAYITGQTISVNGGLNMG